jgi:hypothetical protein
MTSVGRCIRKGSFEDKDEYGALVEWHVSMKVISVSWARTSQRTVHLHYKDQPVSVV